MKWKELIEEITADGGSGDSAQDITGIEYDSRRVKPGAVFVAMKGGSTDGNRYVEKAIATGALGIITDSSQCFDHLLVYQAGLPVLEVEHGRSALAQASAASLGIPNETRYHGHHGNKRQDDDGFSYRLFSRHRADGPGLSRRCRDCCVRRRRWVRWR